MNGPYYHAALVADALSLGPHWVYNQGKIARLYPDGVTEFTNPASAYHPNRRAGQLTHYGDQVVLLRNSLEKRAGFTSDGWREDWVEGMQEYDGYLDGASKETLASGGVSSSDSNDLAGASRLAPILDLDISLDEKISAARSQTGLTHGDLGVIEAAEFFVRAVDAIEAGNSFEQAFRTAATEGDYSALSPSEDLEKALRAEDDFLKTGSSMGLTCHLPEAFPLTLYFALRTSERSGENFESVISENGLAGGDTSARAILLAILFAARDGDVGSRLITKIKLGSGNSGSAQHKLEAGSNDIIIDGPAGKLAGILEVPSNEEGEIGEIKAFALFAHCFTCGKDFLPGVRITKGLAEKGVATLRIDFSGLGKSGGSFGDSSFLTNVEDLVAAANWLRTNHAAPSLLIGHSLGGAAVLASAGKIEEVKAVTTIGAPADPGHVTHLFGDDISKIETQGEAEVNLAGRKFTIGKKFLDDLKDHQQSQTLSKLEGIEVMVMHSPTDNIVALENAGQIYSALNQPKSFISLAGADHLLTKEADAGYVVDLIQVWASRALQI